MLANASAPPPPPPAAAAATSSSENNPTAQQRPALRCPRCDSSNTKFCYYNNYSLSQPRHFCKSCRRYWTHGGALRNVPIGGASRKSKKPRRRSPAGATAPLADFQLAGSIPSFPPPPLARINYPPTNLSSPFGDLNLNPPPPPNFLGLSNFSNYPLVNSTNNYTTAATTNEGSSSASSSFLASSIESLSSLNQELHWKLQQQRMSLLFDDVAVTTTASHVEEKQQPIFPHSTPGSAAGNSNTPWLFDTSFGGGSGSRNKNCGNGNENEGNEIDVVASRLNVAGGYVLDKDGVIKFQQYA